MAMNIRWLALVLSLGAVPALAESPGVEGVYAGSLGTQEIVLEIRPIEDTNYDGRYFYRRHGVGIPLTIAQLPDGALHLKEMRGDAPTGSEWRLTIAGEKAVGEFCKCDVSERATAAKPRAAIALTQIPAAAAGDGSDAYNRELLAFPLSSGAEIRVDSEIAYVMDRDSRFGAALPRLTRFPVASVTVKVNEYLAQALNDLRLDAAECQFGALTANDAVAYWEQAYRVAAIDRAVLSIGGFVGKQCGDSWYPNDQVASLIYDLRTGQRFDFERDAKDFFRSPTPPYDALLALYDKHRGKPKGDCAGAPSGDDPDIKGRMYFAQKGLVIDPHDSVPHAFAGCAPEITIPYREIRDLVRPDSPFYALISR